MPQKRRTPATLAMASTVLALHREGKHEQALEAVDRLVADQADVHGLAAARAARLAATVTRVAPAAASVGAAAARSTARRTQLSQQARQVAAAAPAVTAAQVP